MSMLSNINLQTKGPPATSAGQRPELNASRPTSQSSFPTGDEQALMEFVRKVPREGVMTALTPHMGERKFAR